MTETVLLWPLIVVLAFTLTCLLIGVLFSRIHWGAKSCLIVTSAAMLALFHYGLTASLGWAVRLSPPAEFQFLSADIREPAPGGDGGAIWLWLRPVAESRTGNPRAILLPYSRPLHEKVEQARQKGKDGSPVFMKTGEAGPPAGGSPMRSYGEGEGEPVLDFTPPPSTVPEKDPS
jgi:hypothetical protein